MDARELKLHLLEEPSRIEDVLEHYGFSMFWKSGDEIRCAPPESENRTACSVRLGEELYASLYSMEGFNGDIYGLIEKVSKDSFSNILKTIKEMMGITSTGTYQKKLDLFSNVNKYLRKGNESDDLKNKTSDITILNKFIHLPHESFLREGIAPDVLSMFKVCYDPERDRIVIPHFDWNEHERIAGMAGRTTLTSLESKELNVPKYWHYLKGYLKTHNLFGWNHASKNVDDKGMLIIFESEKSVLKQVTREINRECYSVSVGGHTVSESQINHIIKYTHPGTEIVLAFDKDVMTMKDDEGNEIGEAFIREIGERILPYRRVSYIWDGFGLLGEKDSPIDKSVKEWKVLLKYRREVE